jgi:hypothetical protein
MAMVEISLSRLGKSPKVGHYRVHFDLLGIVRAAEVLGSVLPVSGWLTEDFDTPDLKDAKALLDELRG